jgi:hypothetical protein
MGDKENSGNDRPPVLVETYADDDYAYDYFVSVRMEAHDKWAAEKKATFLASLRPRPTPDSDQSSLSVRLRQVGSRPFGKDYAGCTLGKSKLNLH